MTPGSRVLPINREMCRLPDSRSRQVCKHAPASAHQRSSAAPLGWPAHAGVPLDHTYQQQMTGRGQTMLSPPDGWHEHSHCHPHGHYEWSGTTASAQEHHLYHNLQGIRIDSKGADTKRAQTPSPMLHKQYSKQQVHSGLMPRNCNSQGHDSALATYCFVQGNCGVLVTTLSLCGMYQLCSGAHIKYTH